MALTLHIAGPGLDTNRQLTPGEAPLVLGRDADCPVCLPDPERNVSRRHLSVWNEGGELHFHVLSVINGVQVAGAELAPGAQGVLAPGQTLVLGAYGLTVAAGPVEAADPWTEFERQASELVPAEPADTGAPEDDPFGDWGFADTFGPGSPRGVLMADALAPATDLKPFLAGLGLDPARLGHLMQGELEVMGRLTRVALQGLVQALQSLPQTNPDIPTGERTVAGTGAVNPLRLAVSLQAKLDYLFGGQGAAAGCLPPDQAVAEAVGEVLGHQRAMDEAMRELVQAALEQFDPETLKSRLSAGGGKSLGGARAWEAFVKDYAALKQDLPQRVQQLVDQRFAEAYARALVRVNRDTGGGLV